MIFKAGVADCFLACKQAAVSQHHGGGANCGNIAAVFGRYSEGRVNHAAFIKIFGAGHAAGQNDHIGGAVGKKTFGNIGCYGDAVRALDHFTANADGGDLQSRAAQEIEGAKRLNFFKSVR